LAVFGGRRLSGVFGVEVLAIVVGGVAGYTGGEKGLRRI
jgi:hypothetical protein